MFDRPQHLVERCDSPWYLVGLRRSFTVGQTEGTTDTKAGRRKTPPVLLARVMAFKVSGILHVAELNLTEAEDGDQFTVRIGDAITIRLSENSAAGYRWMVSSLDETRVVVTSQGYQATSAAVGSAGTAVWRLAAKLVGTTRVELKKSRPWEPADSVNECFAVDLDIIE